MFCLLIPASGVPEMNTPVPNKDQQDIILDAWDEVLGQVLAKVQDDFEQHCRLIKAEHAAAAAEARAMIGQVRLELERQIAEKLQRLRQQLDEIEGHASPIISKARLLITANLSLTKAAAGRLDAIPQNRLRMIAPTGIASQRLGWTDVRRASGERGARLRSIRHSISSRLTLRASLPSVAIPDRAPATVGRLLRCPASVESKASAANADRLAHPLAMQKLIPRGIR
jgi:hypothetical protein